MEPSTSNSGQILIDLLLKCHQLEKHIAGSLHISVEELYCLTLLHLRKPRCVKELSSHLGVKGTRTSKLLHSLERRGFIVRTLSQADHRKERVTLTVLGEAAAENVLGASVDAFNRFTETGEQNALCPVPKLGDGFPEAGAIANDVMR